MLSCLHEDVKLKSNRHGIFDMVFEDGDLVQVKDLESLNNACIIAIMTRYRELDHNKLYEGFGCRVHELIKDNMNAMTQYKIEIFIEETLKNIRRVQRVNEVKVVATDQHEYTVYFNITSINNEYVSGVVEL